MNSGNDEEGTMIVVEGTYQIAGRYFSPDFPLIMCFRRHCARCAQSS